MQPKLLLFSKNVALYLWACVNAANEEVIISGLPLMGKCPLCKFSPSKWLVTLSKVFSCCSLYVSVLCTAESFIVTLLITSFLLLCYTQMIGSSIRPVIGKKVLALTVMAPTRHMMILTTVRVILLSDLRLMKTKDIFHRGNGSRVQVPMRTLTNRNQARRWNVLDDRVQVWND